MSQLKNSPTSSATSHKPSTQQVPQPKPGGHEQLSTKLFASQSKPPPPFQPKKAPGRSSKPIINWFQRKLAGTVRHNRRVPEGGLSMHTRPDGGVAKAQARVGPTGSRAPTRVASSPFPQPSLLTPPRNGKNEGSVTVVRRKTLSLNGDDDGQIRSIHSDEDDDLDRSSYARESTWSPASNLEADEDASIRPLPPSGPPSPSPSLSASSYLSDPHTFRSIAVSTKPTTLLSIDLTPDGMAHIAQVPASQTSRFQPHVRNSSIGTSGGVIGSGASITFSALPPSLQSSSRPSSLNNVRSGSLHSGTQQNALNTNAQMSVQAPLHTTHHPRNNPRPSSPPEDNASMLTLASSAFAVPGTRMGLALTSGTLSAMAGDSVSHFGGSVIGDGEGEGEGDVSSQYILGDDDRLDVDGERDVDASLRALRPRSSRRGSWDSVASDWSAQVGSNGAGMSTGTPSRSLWTSNSGRTGGDGTTRRSEGESVDDLEPSLEHQTPLQGVDPLPAGDEDVLSPAEKTSLSEPAVIVPKKESGDGLNQSHEVISAALPILAQGGLLEAIGNGNGPSAPERHLPKN